MLRRPPWRHASGRALLGALGLLAYAGCDAALHDYAPRPAAPPNVILITVDTLRADHLGLYGYERGTTPRIDGFFGQGLVVDRAYSTEGNTSPSVASILTGLLPQQHGVRMLYQLVPEDILLLPERLPDRYESAAVVSNIVLTDEAMGLARAFDHFDDQVSQRVDIPGHPIFERDAAATTDAALAWLASRTEPERPFLLWVHYIDPHSPYRPPAEHLARFTHEGRIPTEGKFISPSVRIDGVTDALDYVDRYDAEIAYMDAEVGRLIDGIGERTDVDDALWLFTADHGESMNERLFWFSHGQDVHDEVVRVPLMLRGPGIAARRIESLGSGVDIVPSVLGFLGLPGLEGSPGIDLRTAADRPDERWVFTEATHPLAKLAASDPATRDSVGYWRAVVEKGAKWMIGQPFAERRILERRVYDLERDPDELRPEAWRASAAADALERLIERDPAAGGLPDDMRAGALPSAPKVAPRIPPEKLERLRGLGYVGEAP